MTEKKVKRPGSEERDTERGRRRRRSVEEKRERVQVVSMYKKLSGGEQGKLKR